MLLIFIIGLIIIQCMVSYFIWNAEGAASCEEEFIERRSKIPEFEGGAGEEGEDESGADEGDNY